MADDFRYHIDHHASLVPPVELVDARLAHARAELDNPGLTAAVDAAVHDAVRMQRRLGLLGTSDGEFRRDGDLSAVYAGVDGFDSAAASTAIGTLVAAALAGPVRRLAGSPVSTGRLAKAETDVLLRNLDRSAMLALPSPAFVAEVCSDEAQAEKAGAELAQIIQAEVAALAADGVAYVLLRNPIYAFLLTDDGRTKASSLGVDADATLARMAATDGLVLDGLALPETFALGLDVTTAGAASGPWAAASTADFLSALRYGRLCVEYPAEHAQRFPVGLAAEELVLSLGVVDVSATELEDVDELVGRIDDAVTERDVDTVAVSTNGGFHISSAPLTAAQGRAKLQLVEMTARYFWGNEL